MLKLLFGGDDGVLAGHIINEISERAGAGEAGQILLVPEQYSHIAERQLCSMGGDGISLRAQVLSFRRLARRVFEQEGGLARQTLSEGGRLLTMAVCMSSLRDSLGYFNGGALRPDVCKELLSAVTELKNSRIEPEELASCALTASGSAKRKFSDMALLYGAYNALTREGPGEPEDELTLLAEKLEGSDFARGRHIYILGFTDFTAQQQRVVRFLTEEAASLTVALSRVGSGLTQQKTAAALRDMASTGGIPVEVSELRGELERPADLRYLSRNVFDYSAGEFPDEAPSVTVQNAGDMEEECTAAACLAIDLVRNRGWRWRDITVAVRGYSSYQSTLSSVFARFGVPLYTGDRQDMALKSEIAAILAAIRTVTRGYEYEDIFTYLKTGLGGLSPEECDLLENYVLQWNIRGSRWTRPDPWLWHPSDRTGKLNEKDSALLERINALREKAAGPLFSLEESLKSCEKAVDFCRAVYDFCENIGLRDILEGRCASLYEAGELAAADEYRQLWDIIRDALDQFVTSAGDVAMTAEEYYSFLRLLFSTYSAGIIPVAVDRVNSGDLIMTRYGQCKALLILGAADGRLPPADTGGGVFTKRDRQLMSESGLSLAGNEEDSSRREMDAIAAALSLPSELLYISWASGGEAQPSFLVGRVTRLLPSVKIQSVGSSSLLGSREGCFLLACRSLGGEEGGEAASAAAALSEDRRIAAVRDAIAEGRQTISPESVRGLYGAKLHLTPSRAETFNKCAFSYYVSYGLKAKPRIAGEFDARDKGTYMHHILENVCREVKAAGGFGKVSEEQLLDWVRKYTDEYVRDALDNFAGRTKRFEYLFDRLTQSAAKVVLQLADELKKSEFEPLRFEVDFSDKGDIPPIEYAEAHMSLTGKVDRVDGWVHDGKLYIRVVDYKTGSRKLDLSDVWNGLSLQMLIYLFALQKDSRALFGKGRPIVPAGVLYVHAGDKTDTLDLKKGKSKPEKHSGLLLDDPEVLAAMESGKAEYLPLTGGSLATDKQFRQLDRFIESSLKKLADEIAKGKVDPDPFFAGSDSDPCKYCDFASDCRFKSGERRRLRKLRPEDFWQELDKAYGKEGKARE